MAETVSNAKSRTGIIASAGLRVPRLGLQQPRNAGFEWLRKSKISVQLKSDTTVTCASIPFSRGRRAWVAKSREERAADVSQTCVLAEYRKIATIIQLRNPTLYTRGNQNPVINLGLHSSLHAMFVQAPHFRAHATVIVTLPPPLPPTSCALRRWNTKKRAQIYTSVPPTANGKLRQG